MNDGIIKETGTSRLMRASLPATYEEFRLKAAAGTQPLDIMFNADGWTQLPTFLNTANLLKAATAALYGFGADATPNDVFAEIRNYVEATLNVPAGTEDPAAYLDDLLDEYIAKKRNKSIGFVCLTFGAAHPVLLGYTYIVKLNIITQNYATIEAIAYSGYGVKKYTRCKYGGEWGEWRNEDHLETGSYTGAGIHGESYKNSLTFGILPRFVLIFGPSSFAFYKWGDATLRVFIPGSGSGTYDNSATTDGKTMTWYTTTPGERDGSTQLNANEKYNYVAI